MTRFNATESRKQFLAEALYEPVMTERLGTVMTWGQWEEYIEKQWEDDKSLLVSTYSELFNKSKSWTNWVVPLIGRASVRKYVRVYMNGAGYTVGIVPLKGMIVVKEMDQRREYIQQETIMAHAYGVARSRTLSESNKIVESNLRLSAPALRQLSSGE